MKAGPHDQQVIARWRRSDIATEDADEDGSNRGQQSQKKTAGPYKHVQTCIVLTEEK